MAGADAVLRDYARWRWGAAWARARGSGGPGGSAWSLWPRWGYFCRQPLALDGAGASGRPGAGGRRRRPGSGDRHRLGRCRRGAGRRAAARGRPARSSGGAMSPMTPRRLRSVALAAVAALALAGCDTLGGCLRRPEEPPLPASACRCWNSTASCRSIRHVRSPSVPGGAAEPDWPAGRVESPVTSTATWLWRSAWSGRGARMSADGRGSNQRLTAAPIVGRWAGLHARPTGHLTAVDAGSWQSGLARTRGRPRQEDSVPLGGASPGPTAVSTSPPGVRRGAGGRSGQWAGWYGGTRRPGRSWRAGGVRRARVFAVTVENQKRGLRRRDGERGVEPHRSPGDRRHAGRRGARPIGPGMREVVSPTARRELYAPLRHGKRKGEEEGRGGRGGEVRGSLL